MHIAALLVPLQIFVGDLHGLNTLKHQPAKVAALEALWKTERGAALTLFGIPNEKEKRTDYAVMIPKGAALILAHDADAELKGLDAFKDHPPVAPVFWAFRVMVGNRIWKAMFSPNCTRARRRASSIRELYRSEFGVRARIHCGSIFASLT